MKVKRLERPIDAGDRPEGDPTSPVSSITWRAGFIAVLLLAVLVLVVVNLFTGSSLGPGTLPIVSAAP